MKGLQLYSLVIGLVYLVRLSAANPALPGYDHDSLPGVNGAGTDATQDNSEDLPSSEQDTQLQDQHASSDNENQEQQGQGLQFNEDNDGNLNSQQEGMHDNSDVEGHGDVSDGDSDQLPDTGVIGEAVDNGDLHQDNGDEAQRSGDQTGLGDLPTQDHNHETGLDGNPQEGLSEPDTHGNSHVQPHQESLDQTSSTVPPVTQEPEHQSGGQGNKMSEEVSNPEEHGDHVHYDSGSLPGHVEISTNTESEIQRDEREMEYMTESLEQKRIMTESTPGEVVTLREAALPNPEEENNNTISSTNHENSRQINHTDTEFDIDVPTAKRTTTKSPSDNEHVLIPYGGTPDIIHGDVPSERTDITNNVSVPANQTQIMSEPSALQGSGDLNMSHVTATPSVVMSETFHLLPTQTFLDYNFQSETIIDSSSADIPVVFSPSSAGVTVSQTSYHIPVSPQISTNTFQHSISVQSSYFFDHHIVTDSTPVLTERQSNLVQTTTDIITTVLHIPSNSFSSMQASVPQNLSEDHSRLSNFSMNSTVLQNKTVVSSMSTVSNVLPSVAVFPMVSQGLVINDDHSLPTTTTFLRTTLKRQTSEMFHSTNETYDRNSSSYATTPTSDMENVTVALVNNGTASSATTNSTKKFSRTTPSTTLSKKPSRMSTKGADKPSRTMSPIPSNRTNANSTSAPYLTLLSTTTNSKTIFIPSPDPAVYITIELQMKPSDFRQQKHMFVKELIRVVQPQIQVEEQQVVLMNIGPFLINEDSHEKVVLNLYIQDLDGKVDISLTTDVYKYIDSSYRGNKTSQFGKKLVTVKLRHTSLDNGNTNENEDNSKSKPETGITIVIIIASVGGFCCICLLLLQFIIHKRQHGKRMKMYIPGSGRLSIRSMDSIALGVVPKSRPNSGLWNPAMEQDDHTEPCEPTHLLDYTALANFTLDTDGQHKEFENLPNEMPRLTSVPVGAEDKNRFANVIPIPHSRVKLKKIPGEDNSDYINANYVRGYNNEYKVYIATQAPMQKTLNDFWRMVWEQQSRTILMLTAMDEQGQPRCIPYWPDSEGLDCRRQYGDYTVVLKKKDIQQEYTVSVLELKDIENNLIREIHHFWYTSWPTDGTPEPVSLVKFMLDTRPHYEDSGAPVIVHCCPGTGRTGTLIALDISMRSFEARKKVDVLNCVYKMREDRAGAVQTCQQYGLIYKSVFEYATVVNSPRVSVTSTTNSLHHML